MQQKTKAVMQKKLSALDAQLRRVNVLIEESAKDYDLEGQVNYLELLNRRDQIESRIQKAEEALQNIYMLDAKKKSDDVRLGSRFRMRNGSGEMTAQLVDKLVTMGEDLVVSIKSPLGQALVGKAPGEQVSVEAPNGNHVYEVLEVLA